VESSCECGYEPSGSMKCWETIEWLHNWCFEPTLGLATRNYFVSEGLSSCLCGGALSEERSRRGMQN
jgi:hypothetical protein